MENKDMPAMPFLPTQDRHDRTSGLTKREYFAGLAMQGLMVNVGRNGFHMEEMRSVADKALDAADALLEELSK